MNFDAIFADGINVNTRSNNYTDYLEYYLPSDVVEDSSDELSYSFCIDKNRFVMNINVSNIINYKYYYSKYNADEGFFDEDKLVYSIEDELYRGSTKVKFIFKAYEYEDKCLLYFSSRDVNAYGYTNKQDAVLLAKKMIQVAASADVDNDKIIADFSSMDVIDYQKSVDNLFGSYFPTDGRIDDLMIDKTQEVSEE